MQDSTDLESDYKTTHYPPQKYVAIISLQSSETNQQLEKVLIQLSVTYNLLNQGMP